jgi:hypothetical protein
MAPPNPQVLDNRTWRFLYSQITTGQIGQQALLDSTPGILAGPTFVNGLFKTSIGATRSGDNFYTDLTNGDITFSVPTTSAFTNEITVLANYYAQKQNGSETLLGYMGYGTTADGTINIGNLTETKTKYHTILFNTNVPNQASQVITIQYRLINTSKFTENITVSTPPTSGQNYIYQLTQATDAVNWDNIRITVYNSSNFTTNFVGILKTTNPVTPANLVCFAENSMVFTPNGEVPIQNLKQGDIVYDENFNHQTVEFVAKRTVFPSKSINKYSIPYEIKQGQLSENVPNRDTIVSAAHLISHNGQMVPASKLGNPIDVDSAITFYNVSVSNYSTMIVNGMVSETLDTTNDSKVYEKTF